MIFSPFGDLASFRRGVPSYSVQADPQEESAAIVEAKKAARLMADTALIEAGFLMDDMPAFIQRVYDAIKSGPSPPQHLVLRRTNANPIWPTNRKYTIIFPPRTRAHSDSSAAASSRGRR